MGCIDPRGAGAQSVVARLIIREGETVVQTCLAIKLIALTSSQEPLEWEKIYQGQCYVGSGFP